MIYWLTALVVWIAAGARVGRVLVRPATTVRVAIVVAVAAVAAAATVTVPDVADRIDGIVRGSDPANPPDLAARIVLALWVCFIAATCAVAAAAWPVISRKSLRNTAIVIYAIGVVVAVLALLGLAVLGWAVVAFGGVLTVVTALRNVDRSPLGRGIAIFAIGTAFVVGGAVDLAIHAASDSGVRRSEPSWLWCSASLLISIGAVWILVEIWIRARLLMRRVRALHAQLTERFPEVIDDSSRPANAVLRSSDQVANIMDALYLQAGGGMARRHTGRPPQAAAERARVVARWVREPMSQYEVDTRWITPPDGVSTRRWVGEIARAYSARA